MAKKEAKPKTIQELRKEAEEAKEALLDLRLAKAQNKLKNLRSIFMKRKEIARLLTQVRHMELAQKEAKLK